MIDKIIVYIVKGIYSKYNKIKLKTLHFGHLGDNVRILDGFEIGYSHNFFIENDVLIGSNSYINAQGGVEIKRGTITGPNLTIYSVNHKYLNVSSLPFDDDVVAKKVIINENCWLGCNVTILPGVEIGEGSIVAAGSVLIKNIQPFSLVGGNPAKFIKDIKSDNYFELKKQNKIYNYLNKR